MSKYQIVLVIVAVALIGLLYNLPKIIVSNKKQQLDKNIQPQASSSVHNNADSLNIKTIPNEELNQVKTLQRALVGSADKSEKIKLADSLASIYKKNNRFDSAAYYKELISELSPSQETWEKAGDMYAEAASFSADPKDVNDNSERARKYYDQILKEAPKNLNVKSKMAMTYVSTETPMVGIKMLREVVEEDPNNEIAIFNLGILSIQSKQYDKAAKRFEKLVDLNPEHWKARFYLGISYKETGNIKEAREQFELVKKLEQDPEVLSIVNSYLDETSSN